jgi:hypothetical protein
MDNAYVRNVASGQLLSPNPIAFVRLPNIGELISTPPTLWTVVRVLHGWTSQSVAVAELHVSQAASHLTPIQGHVNPFSGN